MTSRREPIATPAARGKLGRAWFYIGLAVAMLLCITATPKSAATLVSSVISSGADVVAQADGGGTLALASDAPQYRQGGHAPCSSDELRAFEAETEESDASSEALVVVTPLGFAWGPSSTRAGALADALTGDTARLLISTGLGRGPPLS